MSTESAMDTLLNVPRFSSSPIVAVVAESTELRSRVAVRVVGYPGKLCSAALASATAGLHQPPLLLAHEGGLPVVEAAAIIEVLLEGAGSALRVAPGEPGRGRFLSLLVFAVATLKPLVSNAIFLAQLAEHPDAEREFQQKLPASDT